MANLRNLIGKYVMRTKPVPKTDGSYLLGFGTDTKDYTYMTVNRKYPFKCVDIVDDIPILTGGLGAPHILSKIYDDDNWADITNALKRCEELWEESNE